MKFELVLSGSADHVVVPYFQDQTNIETGSIQVDPALLSGKQHDLYSVWVAASNHHLHFLGLGDIESASRSSTIFNSVGLEAQKRGWKNLLVDLRHLEREYLYPCVLGLARSDYQIGQYKTEKTTSLPNMEVKILLSNMDQDLEDICQEAQDIADSIKRVMSLVDAPANVKTPQYLANWALESGKTHNYQVEIISGDALESQGLHALKAVGQGSIYPPVLIKIAYKPNANKAFQLGLVGKGVTFDTGGISIKKSTNMHYMKSDMGGAASVMGAMETIARLQLPVNVVAVVPVAENAVDGQSIRPGDVISSYSQKSIEIIDTDAEGRLILADALAFIQDKYSPETVLDLATLTGSSVATLGFHAAAAFTNNDDLFLALEQAGQQEDERIWRLPLWKEYEEDLHSDVADIRNFSGKPIAGAITAAKFLEYFIKDHPRWAHLDIAGVAFGTTKHAKMKSATGYGVRLLTNYARSLSSN